ncbi:uncharacterized protein Fot_49813 [Forsythia ovata]|uniref:Uncharacterized protein n=1 Tax=Forsythia ovata TaxID=205694 RepID=A0ABD1QCX5_9LAMI
MHSNQSKSRAVCCIGAGDIFCDSTPSDFLLLHLNFIVSAGNVADSCYRVLRVQMPYIYMVIKEELQFDLPSEKANQVHSKRPSKPPTIEKPTPPAVESRPPRESGHTDDIPSISA